MIRLLALWLLLAVPAAAAELKVATWNLEWLTLRPAGDPALPRHAPAPGPGMGPGAGAWAGAVPRS